MDGRWLMLWFILVVVIGCERDRPVPPQRDVTESSSLNADKANNGPKEVKGLDDPMKQLQGEWVAVQGESQGESFQGPEAEAFLSQFKFRFEGDAYTAVSPKTTYKGTFVVDSSSKPMRMKMHKDSGAEVGAIFEFRNGRLFFCATEPGAPAPKEFKTAPNSSALFTIYKKVR
jgi:uncharacterized protein (TIGR03067 family)